MYEYSDEDGEKVFEPFFFFVRSGAYVSLLVCFCSVTMLNERDGDDIWILDIGY